MKRLLLAILSTAMIAFAALTPARAEDEVVMVELFTSQGCSSCPPADRALAALTTVGGVLPLSLHVDYWDYLGWRDTFASTENTERQYVYRDRFGARVVYTPQMIIQGTRQAPGYRTAAIREAIAEIAAQPRSARIAIVERDGSLSAEITTAADAARSTIWMASYRQSATVMIRRGENAGRKMTYHNVVDKLMRVGPMPGGDSRRVALPLPSDGQGVAIWLQDETTGRILTASFVNR